VKARQREAFQKQANKNGPELTFFEEKLGLKIRGIGSEFVRPLGAARRGGGGLVCSSSRRD